MRTPIKVPPHPSDWREWFAWYPVRVGQQRVWLEYVERREQFRRSLSPYGRWGVWTTEYR